MPPLPLLLSIAPTVASWVLGDKTGAAVEKVTPIAREVLGTDSADAVERAIAADPNVALCSSRPPSSRPRRMLGGRLTKKSWRGCRTPECPRPDGELGAARSSIACLHKMWPMVLG